MGCKDICLTTQGRAGLASSWLVVMDSTPREEGGGSRVASAHLCLLHHGELRVDDP